MSLLLERSVDVEQHRSVHRPGQHVSVLEQGEARTARSTAAPRQNTPPTPSGSWSEDSLNVDCGGQFKLCYTIKAGSVANPKPDDCVVMQTCVDTWYEKAGTDQKLDDLPAWVSSTSASACAVQFATNGGYGEMSVIGKSIECDAVDDGKGNPYVFHRTDYCKPTCRMTPDLPECRACQTGGSGMFGN